MHERILVPSKYTVSTGLAYTIATWCQLPSHTPLVVEQSLLSPINARFVGDHTKMENRPRVYPPPPPYSKAAPLDDRPPAGHMIHATDDLGASPDGTAAVDPANVRYAEPERAVAAPGMPQWSATKVKPAAPETLYPAVDEPA